MTKTPFFPILLVIFCTLLTSSGQYFIKLGTFSFAGSIASIFNINLIIGFSLYSIGGALLILALKYGELSTLYPFIALGFIWVFIISTTILNESVMLINIFGLFFIVSGVSFIGWGARYG